MFALISHLTEEECKIVTVAVRTTQHIFRLLSCAYRTQRNRNYFLRQILPRLLKKDIAAEPHRFATLESDALGFFN